MTWLSDPRPPAWMLRLIMAAAVVLGLSPTIRAQGPDRESRAQRDRTGAELALRPSPITVELPLTDQLRQAIRAGAMSDPGNPDSPVISLLINGLIPTQPAWSGARVFLNLPDDLDKHPPESLVQSPYYAGSFAFFPKVGQKQSFRAPKALGALRGVVERGELEKARTLRVTLIGIPGREQVEKKGVRNGVVVPFSEIVLRVESPGSAANRPGA